MAEQYFADTVDSTGHAYPTVGENIIKGAKEANSIIRSLSNSNDRKAFTTKLDVNATNLSMAIVAMLSGESFYFGSSTHPPLTSEEVTKIKTFLGIV